MVGFRERGATTPPFEMLKLNGLDRHQIAVDAVRHVPGFRERFADTSLVTGWDWVASLGVLAVN